jgi:hypothetical protein
MLVLDVDKRISAEDALKHPWIEKMTLDKAVEKTIAIQCLHSM